MRVLMLGWEYPPRISGGLGMACEGLTRGLVHHGVDVLFVLPREFGGEQGRGARVVGLNRLEAAAAGSGASAHEPLLGGLSRVALASRLRPYLRASDYAATEAVVAPGELSGGYGPTLFSEVERYARTIGGLAEGERFDVVHAHDWMTWPAGLLARERTGRPLVCHVHACEYDRCGDAGDARIEEVEAYALREADRVVCVSGYTAEVLRRRYGIGAKRVSVVHNAVDRPTGTALRKPVDEPPVVLFLGRVTHQKGPETFLAAAERVAVSVPEARFVVVGDGDLLPAIIERTAELGLSRRVLFTGFLGREDVARAYARADVYVMPSVSEPFGIAPLEALAQGVPVVVSSASGVAEVLPSALCVAPGDAEDLARKVTALLTRPALRQRAVRRGRRELARLRWETSGRTLAKLYGELIA